MLWKSKKKLGWEVEASRINEPYLRILRKIKVKGCELGAVNDTKIKKAVTVFKAPKGQQICKVRQPRPVICQKKDTGNMPFEIKQVCIWPDTSR